MTSKDIQRKFVLKDKILSGITSLYDEKEVCEVVDCELYKKLQFINRPTSKLNDYYTYSEKFRNNMYKYIYGNGNITAAEVLNEIEDITRIYCVTLNSKASSLGIILFAFSLVLIVGFILSLSVLYSEKYKNEFNFIPNDFWILIIIGIIMVIIMSCLEIAQKTTYSCYIKHFLLTFGFTLTFIPLLYKILAEFPLENKISDWISEHRYLFLLSFLVLEMLFNFILILGKYDAETIRDVNGKNYQVCSSHKQFGKVIIGLETFVGLLIFLVMLICIFLEWNVERTFYDVRILSIVCAVNIIILTIYTTIKFVDIQHYMVFYVTRECIYWTYILSNYFFIYISKILLPVLIDKNAEERNAFFKNNSCGNSESNIRGSHNSVYNSKSGLVNNLFKLHNSNGKMNSQTLSGSNTNTSSIVKSATSKT